MESDDKRSADQLEQCDRHRLTAATQEEWTIAGSCWAPAPVRESELSEFQRGYRDFIVWAVGISALTLVLAVLIG